MKISKLKDVIYELVNVAEYEFTPTYFKNIDNACVEICEKLDKLADYEDKLEQGLLLELPVRIGEVVYFAECGEIITDSLYAVNKDNKGLWAINQYGGIIGRFGHTVFATRSEAEEALAKMKGE